MGLGTLSVIIIAPFVLGLVAIALASITPARYNALVDRQMWIFSLGTSFIVFAFTTLMWIGNVSGFSNLSLNEYAYLEETPWIPSIGVSWILGVDGLSMPLVWMTAFLIPVSILISRDETDGRYFHPLLLIMGSALMGVFVALDMVMFYIFYEFTLIPMFFLILKWGGENRRYAAQKFMIYTFFASVIMLLGLLATSFLMGPGTEQGCHLSSITNRCFDMRVASNIAGSQGDAFLGGIGMQRFVFLLLLIGFLVKLPAIPVHTWLPDAHVEAPTAGSMILAGVMLKMGGYGLIRFGLTIFSGAIYDYRWLLLAIGMISLVYGAMVCLGQTNLKRMVAYSSISHMGLVLLGVATLQPLGITGAIFMLFAHGLISPLLFAVCGSFKHHYHTMEIGEMRGLARHSPSMGAFMMFGWMASLGLPLLAGFVAELAVMLAFWDAFGWWVIPPALTLIITAGYYLWSMQRTIFEGGLEGELPESLGSEEPRDLTVHEVIAMGIMAAPIVVFGIMPFLVFTGMEHHSTELLLRLASILGGGI